MRELNSSELAEVSGAKANPPLIAAAGGTAIGVAGYAGIMHFHSNRMLDLEPTIHKSNSAPSSAIPKISPPTPA
jgi:hypothetical protein